jgi:methyl-accepting chemotaxis protein
MQAKTTVTTRQQNMLRTLKFKLIMVSTALILISVISLTLTFIQRQKAQIRAQLVSRGETITRLIAYNARYGVQIGDKPILDKIIGGVVDDPDVLYCLISDNQKKIITSHNQDRADVKKIDRYLAVADKAENEYTNARKEDIINIAMPVILASAEEDKKASVSASGGDEFDDGLGLDDPMEDRDSKPSPAATSTAAPAEKRVIGSVQVGISLNNMKKELSASVQKTVLFSALIFVVGFILAFWIGTLISAPVKKIVMLLDDISQGEGDLTQRVNIKSNDEIGDLASGFNTFMDKFQEIKKISVFLNELADGGGDLTKRLNIPSEDEIGMLAKGFDRFTNKLHEIICQVADNTEKIAQTSQMVSDTTTKLARELDEVARQSSEVAQSSQQITHAIQLTSENVSNVNELMNKTEGASSGGVEIVHETRNGMGQIAETIKLSAGVVGKLNESSQKIGDTITTIKEIADQTKLIAINAAIEASRVGTQGKGFAVVAEEIRRLAARVTKATQDISQRIRAIQDESSEVVAAMTRGRDEAGHGLELSKKSESSLEEISGSVVEARSKVNEIAIASNEQTSFIGTISRSISGISGSAKACSEGVTQTAVSMQELNREVQALRQLVGKFVLDR